MSPMFCCIDAKPYWPQRTDHEFKFSEFKSWAMSPDFGGMDKAAAEFTTYAVQLVQQVNFGRLESKCYFLAVKPEEHNHQPYIEVQESDLVNANYEKVNS
ncbi:hypothetical protein EJ08DRAFT_647085 [Tothia fuscella]|uniref:Uncharacterized protein n=1 Tax=Tothia fuscella TaxID=1048955 RepID=A0A9P4U2B7_9PEZI|nr:hypothetical protein EJ08DRAFT_647085 [Tothia fuscella]